MPAAVRVPYLVEYKTFRMALHCFTDRGGYVNPEDLEKWGKRDPIDICQRKLLDKGTLMPKEDQKLRDEVKREVEDAVASASASPDPTVDDLFEDLYAQKGVIY
jgi:pyruvate dehydrogenase E1 component alpha subunit